MTDRLKAEISGIIFKKICWSVYFDWGFLTSWTRKLDLLTWVESVRLGDHSGIQRRLVSLREKSSGAGSEMQGCEKLGLARSTDDIGFRGPPLATKGTILNSGTFKDL